MPLIDILSLITDALYKGEYLLIKHLILSSIVDLENSFFHVLWKKRAVNMSFVISNEQYEFIKMPFELHNLLDVLQRFVNNVFWYLVKEKEGYSTDIYFSSDNYRDRIKIQYKILRKAKTVKLWIKWSYWEWDCKSIASEDPTCIQLSTTKACRSNTVIFIIEVWVKS